MKLIKQAITDVLEALRFGPSGFRYWSDAGDWVHVDTSTRIETLQQALAATCENCGRHDEKWALFGPRHILEGRAEICSGIGEVGPCGLWKPKEGKGD